MHAVPDYTCVAPTVLLFTRVYQAIIVKSTAHAITTCCACPTGLSGCCNHVTVTFLIKKLHNSGLKEDQLKGCTERLQVQNQPRKRHVEARSPDDVNLTELHYGSQK